MRPIFRPEPLGSPEGYKTYAISAPLATHWRKASCEEIDCEHWRNGWQSIVDEKDARGMAVARYIRKESGRGFHTERLEDGRTCFIFLPGQMCFSAGSDSHRVQIREENFILRSGDYRGNPDGRSLTFPGARDWVDDFGEHQDRIATAIERG